MIETVIVLPVILLVLFGVLEFSIVLGRWQALSNAAREGARLAVVFRTGCNEAAVRDEVRARVEQYAATLGVTPDDVDVQGACGDRDTNSTVIVRDAYDFRVLSGIGTRLAPSLDIQASSVMRNEGTG